MPAPPSAPSDVWRAVLVTTSVSRHASVAEALAACAPGTAAAIHAGPVGGTGGGPTERTCRLIRGAAGAGQVVLSATAAAELGDPSCLVDAGVHRLRDLSAPQRLFVLRGSAQGPLRSLDRVPNNLPTQLTTFVGRDGEVGALQVALGRSRLVTLTGPGGCGKTRLAARAAAEAADRWSGVHWVELAPVADPALVPELVTDAVGALLAPGPGAVANLARQLRDRRVLLCLDNAEHLLDATAELAEALLLDCPDVTVLVTSREPLGVPGEAVWPVPTLDTDDAVALFAERAGGRAVGTEDPAAVRTACARLDGIPLAVELAAAWSSTLTPHQILQGLDDRFSLLVRGPRGVAARHQTLAASIGWSHDLLDDADRVLFRRLAVFGDGWTLTTAGVVCDLGGDLGGAAVRDGLRRLVEKSLVLVADRDGTARYRMLESIGRYAAERLRASGEEAALRERHLDAFLALVEAAAPLLDEDKDAWRTALAAEQENLALALEHGLARPDPERGRRLAAGLPWLWHLTGRGADGLAALRAAVATDPDARTVLQARLLVGTALVADVAAPELELDLAQTALAVATEAGDERSRCLALELCAVGHLYTDLDAAARLNEAAAAAAQEVGDGFVAAGSRSLAGILAHLRDRHAEAAPALAGAADELLARGDRGVAASALGFLASSALHTGDLPAARAHAERAVRVATPLADYHRVGSTRSVLAAVELRAGRPDAAWAALAPVLGSVPGSVAAELPFVPGLAPAVGALHLAAGQVVEAVAWFEREAAGDTYLAALALPGLAAAQRLAGDPGSAAATCGRALATARRLGIPRAIADALHQQAELARGQDPDAAIDLHHEALALRHAHGLQPGCVESLEAIAELVAGQAQPLRAACAAARAEMGLPPPADPTTAGPTTAGPTTPEPATPEPMTLDEAVAYVRRGRGARGRPAAGWSSLTPTELSVVELAVEGLSNPEIAQRLFMGRGTVKTHLAHVYAKLGVANRTGLATVAAGRPPAAP